MSTYWIVYEFVVKYATALLNLTLFLEVIMAARKWIQKAIKHKGALKKALGVAKSAKIPAKKLAKALHSKNSTTKKRAVLAKTLRKIAKRK
jgi:hypothetical protein